MAVAGGEEGGERADEPGSGLDPGAYDEVAAGGDDDGDWAGEQHGSDVDAAEDSVEL